MVATYGIGGLLLFVALLVGSSLGLIGSALLVGQSLPLLSKKLADLTCALLVLSMRKWLSDANSPNLMPGLSSRTFSRCSLAKNI